MPSSHHKILAAACLLVCGVHATTTHANNVDGAWSGVISWPHIAVSAAALPDGDILTWSSNRVNAFPVNNGLFTFAAVYDPDTGQFKNTNHADHDMFCAGISQISDGSILASGGNDTLSTSSLFFSDTHDWDLIEPMQEPRWYGTNLTLANGDVMTTFARGAEVIPEIWSEGAGWTQLPGASMQTLATEQNAVNSARATNATTAQWYAFMHTTPDGRVFQPGPTRTMHWFDTTGVGDVEQAGLRAGETRHRQFGSSVLYDTGKILLSGGADSSRTDSATATAMTIDINGASPVVEPTPPMIAPRTNHDSVILPNGEVIVVGGESSGVLFSDAQSVLPAEIWNPDSREFRQVASISVPRNYHSVALLMRDGRVLSSGGGLCGGCAQNHQNSQIYTPPMLFDEAGGLRDRPVIISALDSSSAGATFELTTDREVNRFTLVRLSSVTHSINTDQRILEPEMEALGFNRYRLTLTANPNVLIPGNYWLYALDDNDTWSTGWPVNIQVGAASPNAPPNLQSLATQVATVGESVSLQLIASDADGDTLVFGVNTLPAGLALDPSSGLVSGIPSSEQTLQSLVTVSDGNLSDTVAIQWEVVTPEPAENELAPDDSVSLAVSRGQWLRYTVAPSGSARELELLLNNLSADADLYVELNSPPNLDSYTCRSWLSGTRPEQCTIAQGAGDRVHIGVYGYDASADFTLTVLAAAGLEPQQLAIDSPVVASLRQGQWRYFTVDNTAGSTDLTVTLDGLTADLDLYLREGQPPNLDAYDCRPWQGGMTAESCELTAASGDSVIIGVYGYSAGQYRITLTQSVGGGGIEEEDGTIALGEFISDAVPLQQWEYFQVTGAAPGTPVSVSLDLLSSDADLYVRTGDIPGLQSYDCRSFAGSNLSEQCTVTQGEDTLWIGVYGYEASDFKLSVTALETTFSIAANTQQTRAISQGQWHYYRVLDSSDSSSAIVTLSGLDADIDLYASASRFPSLTDFDCRSYQLGTSDESCVVNLASDTAIIGVYGYRSGSYTLAVSPSVAFRSSSDAPKIEKGIDVKSADSAVQQSSGPLSVGGGATGWWIWLLLGLLASSRRKASKQRPSDAR